MPIQPLDSMDALGANARLSQHPLCILPGLLDYAGKIELGVMSLRRKARIRELIMKTTFAVRVYLTATAVLASALAACGSEQERAEATGVLHGGSVRGVAYETPTRKGETDANGQFRYLHGETVTFSVGAIELGAARGAPDITLFALAGTTPPTTERLLRRELDLARRMSTPFTRATNIARLLMSLDSDGNPANGLDVRERSAQLATASIDFNLGLYQFDERLHRLAPNLVRRIPLWKPVAQLYGSIGLRVRTHAQVRTDTETLGNTVPETAIFTYGADGSLESESSDQTADGVADFVSRYAYDVAGRTVDTRAEHYSPLDGTVDRRYRIQTSFDERGNETAMESISEDMRSVGSRSHSLNTWDYDAAGNAVGGTWLYDIDGDGNFDLRNTFEAVYDARGNVRTYLWREYHGLDATIDIIMSSDYEYDSQGRLTSRVDAVDRDADGNVDQRAQEVYEYASPHGPTRLVSESDNDADGVVDARTVITWSYDSAGNVRLNHRDIDDDGDGIIERSYNTESTYDSDRRRLTQIQLEDENGDGIVDIGSYTTREFDDVGNILLSVYESDSGFDGSVNLRNRTVHAIGADGAAITMVSSTDADMDGTTDYRSQTDYTHDLRDDGVLLLAQWYLTRTPE
jgi:hypothetical protein